MKISREGETHCRRRRKCRTNIKTRSLDLATTVERIRLLRAVGTQFGDWIQVILHAHFLR